MERHNWRKPEPASTRFYMRFVVQAAHMPDTIILPVNQLVLFL